MRFKVAKQVLFKVRSFVLEDNGEKTFFFHLSTDNYVLSILYRSVRLTQLAFPLQTPVFLFLFYPCTISGPFIASISVIRLKQNTVKMHQI